MTKRIYFDNAATTPLDSEVLEAMLPYLMSRFGNPSSLYSYGRETRLAIETARKKCAQLSGAQPGEIFFTSGGTESNNTAIATAIRDLHCNHIITSPIEHHAVLHTVQYYARKEKLGYSLVQLLPDGHIDMADLERLLKQSTEKSLVTLMHANNEIGNITDIEKAGELCKKYNAVFHSDCVQTVGHYPIELSKMHIHFISASAHKFHGPKGAGMLYVNKSAAIKPFIYGGSQERNIRAGTENVYGIIGFAKALEIAMESYAEDRAHIQLLKIHFIEQLKDKVPAILFNGDPDAESLYTVLSVSLPKNQASETLLLELDQQNVCVSGGSACGSGEDSHVMKALGRTENYISIRFSFNRNNNIEEVEDVVSIIQKLSSKKQDHV